MPNWCYNRFRADFKDEAEADRFERVFSENGDAVFSMECFLPPPEALGRFAEIRRTSRDADGNTLSPAAQSVINMIADAGIHPDGQAWKRSAGMAWDAESRTMRDAASDSPPESLSSFLEARCGMPQAMSPLNPKYAEAIAVRDEVKGVFDGILGTESSTVDEAFGSFLDAAGGYPDPDGWLNAMWGTSRDARATDLESPADLERDRTSFSVEFCTPWRPPVRFLEALSREFPEASFSIDYCEPGMDMWGRFEAHGGGMAEPMKGESKDEIYRSFGFDASDDELIDNDYSDDSDSGGYQDDDPGRQPAPGA